MTRKQRLRTYGNLLQLIETAKTDRVRRVYRMQLERKRKMTAGQGCHS